LVKQVTQYSRSWIEIDLEYVLVDNQGKESGKQAAKVYVSPGNFDSQYAHDAFDAALAQIGNGFSASVCAFRTDLSQNCRLLSSSTIDTQSDHNNRANDLSQILIANNSEYITKVDYSNTYYFNSQTPPFGTAAATVKLAEDGTLTEASGNVDASKLADLIPLKEFLTKKLKLEGAAGIVPASPATSFPRLSLSISTNGFHYKFVEFHSYDSGLNHTAIVFGASSNFVRSEFGKTSGSPVSKNSIEFSGTVKLP
jgi:hypothetical protein